MKNLRLPEISLFIVAAIVPIIVRLAWVTLSPDFMQMYQAERLDDMFSYHKAWVLGVCAVTLIFHFISELVINPSTNFKNEALAYLKQPVIIMVCVYTFFVLLSNILSPHTHTALWGVHDRREGLFIQLAYMTVFLATMYHMSSRDKIRFLLLGFLFSSLIMGAIGFSQFINRDFFATQLAAWLVIGPTATPMTPRFEMAYGTNFNPNTFGLVTAMLFPLLFAAALVFKEKYWRGLFLLAGFLMLTGVVASRSVGGFIGGGTAILALATTLLVRTLIQRKSFTVPRAAIITLAVVVVVLGGVGFSLRGYIYENLSFTMGRISAIFEPPDLSHLPEFEFNGLSLTVREQGTQYSITFPQQGDEFLMPPILMFDGAPESPYITDISPEDAESAILLYSHYLPGFGTVDITQQDNIFMYRNILFTVEDGQLMFVDFRLGRTVDPNEYIPSWGFEGWETWGSNRGHIFSRVIPLLPQSIIIGSGSDTFLLRFPIQDLVSNLRYHGIPYMMVDKAHNLYLQTALTTGLISALALIALFAYYIISTFLSLIKGKGEDGFTFWLRLGILASVSAFSVSSLSTDSTLSSTPMFWLIIGLGFALNKMCLVNKR